MKSWRGLKDSVSLLYRSIIDIVVVLPFIDRGDFVATVIVSSKYQVVIPRKVREMLGIRPGQKIQVLQYENRLEFIPIKSIKEMRGSLRGMNTTLERDRDRV